MKEHLKEHMTRRRAIAVGLALVAILAVSGIAYAYWTVGGSGTGTGTTAAGVSDVTVVQTTTLLPMYPGDGLQTISGNFNNPNSGPVYISTVTASVSSTSNPGCTATDFTFNPATATVNAEIPVGNNVGAWTGIRIQFNDRGVNQDACKGVTVNLAYTIP